MPICLKSLSDNSGAESVSNKLFTTSSSCFFVEKLTLIATMTGTEHDVSHIPGQDNEIADQLSRWDEVSDIPFEFNPDDRVRFILPHLWNPDLTCSLHPNDAYILVTPYVTEFLFLAGNPIALKGGLLAIRISI